MVTTMKRVSIGNLTFAITATPLLLYATQIGGAPGSGIAMSALLLAFGGGTTAGLTFITKTYVKRILTIPGQSAAMAVVTPTFFGGDRSTQVEWDAIQVADSMHPFATFEADGRIYYLDEMGLPHDDFAEKIEAAVNWTKADKPDDAGGSDGS